MSAETLSPPGLSRPEDSPKAPLTDYRGADPSRSIWQLVSTLVGFFVSWTLAWASLEWSYLVTLLLAVPAAGFLVRLFILAHDCGHGSFFKSRWANNVCGSLLGVLTLTPYHRWRKHHAIHHATSGDLDRRGSGDIHMLTVREYEQLSPWKQFLYRIYRHPLILFGVGPTFYFIVLQRLIYEPRTWKQERRSVHLTNLAILVTTAALGYLIGIGPFLAVHMPVVALASSVGVWLFYVQHHYESTYWERRENWRYDDAGLEGSSFYELPKMLQWFTANIGLHHIHHLDSQIPNYRLQACYDENPQLQQVKRLTIRESMACASLRLWDEDAQCMVGIPARP